MTARYKPYAGYQPSDVDWIGDVPTHWNTKRVKFIFQIRKRIAGTLGFNVLSITQRGIKIKDTESGEGQLAMDYSKYQIVETGDFAMNHMDLLTGYIDIASTKGVTSPDYRVFSLVDSECDPRYFLYLFQMAYVNKIFYGLGQGSAQFGRWRLPRDNFENYLVPSMPLAEQRAIATFLDRETGKIDQLVSKQERMIELLKEKRQAVISHAVTKGLNSAVLMKDSGVEWLGAVPENWAVKRIKQTSSIRYGIGEPPRYVDDGVPLVRATNIRSGKISEVNMVRVNPDDIPSARIVWLREGDIIVVRSGAGTGDSSIIPKLHEGSIAGFDMMVRPSSVYPWFLGYALLSSYLRNGQIDLEKTRAAQPHLNAEELGDCILLCPHLNEQQAIAEYLDGATVKIDHLIGKAEQAIELMKERRTALISAAVTGKIDVRDNA